MSKKLERDLGIIQISAISVGAMVGSGIFILPALALDMAGPAVVLAYFLAGLLVLPAALSKSEMATAMPEAGGTYLYIERGMGPMLGTVAGIGTWFSLTFKSGLALVGGVPYVFPEIPVKPVAVGIGVVLILLNLFGTKQSGQFQTGLVVVMLAALIWFVVGSAPQMQGEHFSGFFDKKTGGILKATGFVFVSYAGVTKVASVAEEVEDPSRNIPLGMLGSLGFTTILYVGLVAVMVGVVDPIELAGSVVPMSDAAEATLGTAGFYAVVGAALLALISTANAGIMSASRYPLAMARDRLFPKTFESISSRFETPINAISLTGGFLLLLVAIFPIAEIAKLASAFKILVFIIINLAVVAFREGDKEYDPDFRSPLYPWVQIFGVAGGVVLLPQMGKVPAIGAAVIIFGGMAWYLYWGREESDREGVATSGIRRMVTDKIVRETEEKVGTEDTFRALIAVSEEANLSEEYHLLQLGQSMVDQKEGELSVMQFDEVAAQVPLGFDVERLSPADRTFEEQIRTLEREFGFEATFGEIAAHDIRTALANYAEHKDVDVLILPTGRRTIVELLSERDREWLLRNAPCDVLLVDLGDLEVVRQITVVTGRGAYEPNKLDVADALANYLDVPLRLIHPLERTAASDKRDAIAEYHRKLAEMCRASVSTSVIEVDDKYGDIRDEFASTDLAVIGLETEGLKYLVLERPELKFAESLPCGSILYRPRAPEELNAFERFLEKWTI